MERKTRSRKKGRESQRKRQCKAKLKEYEKEEVNNESHKEKILRTNKSQINCVTRCSDEGQRVIPAAELLRRKNETKQETMSKYALVFM